VNGPMVRPFAPRTARSASEVRAAARKSPRHQRGFSTPSPPPQCPGLRKGGVGIVFLGEAVNAAARATAGAAAPRRSVEARGWPGECKE
jgi:hypothetical protein